MNRGISDVSISREKREKKNMSRGTFLWEKTHLFLRHENFFETPKQRGNYALLQTKRQPQKQKARCLVDINLENKRQNDWLHKPQKHKARCLVDTNLENKGQKRLVGTNLENKRQNIWLTQTSKTKGETIGWHKYTGKKNLLGKCEAK